MKMHGTMRVNSAGHLEIGGCDSVELARRFGTPLWVFDEELIRENCRRYRTAFVERSSGRNVVAYAGKAFLTVAFCRIVEEEGLSLDLVSGGEVQTALAAGFPPERIYLHGNNKSPEELRLALESGVGHIMVDNFHELELLGALAARRPARPRVFLRVTPGIEAHTHEYIKTGQEDSKFGFPLAGGEALRAVRQALADSRLELVGLHCHIGSQIFELEAYAEAARVMVDFLAEIRRETGVLLDALDLGGGLGIYYAEGDTPAPVEELADVILRTVQGRAAEYAMSAPRVIVEPGRSIIGEAGTTLYTVGAVKEVPGIRRYVAVDGGMSDNIRPALYRARYEMALANRMREEPAAVVSVAGKCCESGDMLGWDVSLPEPRPGDILAVSCTGAYGYTMSSNYNRLPRPAAVLVAGGQADVILEREDYRDLLRHDRVPARLAKARAPMAVGRG